MLFMFDFQRWTLACCLFVASRGAKLPLTVDINGTPTTFFIVFDRSSDLRSFALDFIQSKSVKKVNGCVAEDIACIAGKIVSAMRSVLQEEEYGEVQASVMVDSVSESTQSFYPDQDISIPALSEGIDGFLTAPPLTHSKNRPVANNNKKIVVLLNIGSNIDPLKPLAICHSNNNNNSSNNNSSSNGNNIDTNVETSRATETICRRIDDPRAVYTVAFEPLLSVIEKIPPHPNVIVVPAAVSSYTGLATMYQYNDDAMSSSLGKAAADMYWNQKTERGDGAAHVVPVIALQSVLDSVDTLFQPSSTRTPANKRKSDKIMEIREKKDDLGINVFEESVEIGYLKTDMQGADFAAIASVDRASIRKIPFILTEIWQHNVRTFDGFENDLCRNWVPYMIETLGYYIGATNCKDLSVSNKDPVSYCEQDRKDFATAQAGLYECDVLWVRDDMTLSDETRPPVDLSEWIFEPRFRFPSYPRT